MTNLTKEGVLLKILTTATIKKSIIGTKFCC